MPDDVLLEASGVTKHFAGVHAVDDMHIHVASGEVVGLIGPNGAGKSTFFDCLSGFTAKDDGHVTFDGIDISRMRRHRIARAGMVRTFQMTSALERMSVLENLMLAPVGQYGERLLGAVRPRTTAMREAEVREQALAAAEFFSLSHLTDELAGNLSGGQKKLLDLARAMLTKPRLMLLDEPLAGVNPSLRRDIMARVQELQEGGMTFLLIEHDMRSVFDNCDRIVVMADGRFLAEGTPAEVQADGRVREAYLGA